MSKTAPIQTICDNRSIVNHHPLGREIAKTKSHAEALFRHYGLMCGPMDGGCLVFGAVLLSWMRAGGADQTSRLVFVGRPERADHVAVEVAGMAISVFADADGLASAAEIQRKMVVLEGVERPLISPYVATVARLNGVETFEELDLPETLFRLFIDRLGNYTPDRTDLARLDSVIQHST